jgi:predicted TIM-barrel fold metal-dependent hydrolase
MIVCLFAIGQAYSFDVSAQESSSSSAEYRARFDHHVHLLSPHLVRDWKSLGVPFSRPDSFYSSASAVLDQSRVEKAIILSMAYLYGSEGFQRLEYSSEKEYERVRRENDYVASVVRSNPKKLAGFYSVHPLRPYALTEIRRCRDGLGLAGLKLHLSHSRIDLTNAAHLKRILDIFALAQEKGTPILLHLNAVYGGSRKQQVDILVRELIHKHPGVDVYIAHLGGSGGYDSRVEEVLRAFGGHLRRGGMLEGRRVFFELSAVVLTESSEGVEPPGAERLRQLAADLREVGLDRVLFGSDHPVFNAQEYARTLRHKLNMSKEEAQQILGNEAAVLKKL